MGQIEAEGQSIHVVEAGLSDSPSIMLLHGWPESWAAFDPLMRGLGGDARVVAIDLPGIGESIDPPPANDKQTLARIIKGW